MALFGKPAGVRAREALDAALDAHDAATEHGTAEQQAAAFQRALAADAVFQREVIGDNREAGS